MSNTPVNHSTIVTPCVGVWIETAALLFPMLQVLRSHPAWVCGLKQKWSYNNNLIGWSHPAWVCGLKHYAVMFNDFKPCHTLRGCVD